MVKDIIIRFVQNQNDKLKRYFSMKRLFDHLMGIAKDFYFISIVINTINDGIKNPKRLKISNYYITNLTNIKLQY